LATVVFSGGAPGLDEGFAAGDAEGKIEQISVS
jgi:hypothetical protein